MRPNARRGLALFAAASLVLAACGEGEDDTGTETTDEQPTDGVDDGALDDPAAAPELEDPNEDVEDGVYRGSGITLPVPDGFRLDEQAFAQGIVAAIDADATQQLIGQAIDADEAAAAGGGELDLDTLLEGVRDQVPDEPDVDEEIELEGAERAHRLTFLDVDPGQEGVEPSSVTIVLAEDGDGLLGEFTYSAATDAYDEDAEATFLEGIGFDPDSEPAPLPALPQGDAPADAPPPADAPDAPEGEDAFGEDAADGQDPADG
ncbi:hypothetical protein FTX61_03880 [Nitriliruptoraceae bacterium ZYF776]|nr:hypothetical protein [Profundirhabdus halotolerans]